MAEYGFGQIKKGCVNLSLRDSGTKSKKFLRVLAVFAVVVVLFVSIGMAAYAETEKIGETSVEQGEANTFDSGYPMLPENATLSECFMYGLQVAGIGMAVVFLVLILLMAILYIFKLVATSVAKKPTEAPATAPVVSAPVASSSEDESTVVAVATAAIAASRGASACAFKVISITKIQ